MSDHAVVLEPLIADLRDQIRQYEQSRRLHLSPALRSARIRERQAWIDAITSLLDEHRQSARDAG